ncbi:STAS domain-containing protein [Leptospira yasudae]|uniref:Anti-sigma factor antagonist n=1 Tax=Leptospira yasudae TaxID=2202201 RepID=A0A6N4QCX6_9LEPT|nr:STAS domain-containing protein [Leptospira yasudae]TGL74499.1 anti-sigma factor antagonist [Leptospira yasudae]TGL82288.1 anti-sigma factor antagonist [Leptospira yasudae]TGL89041.1 anti-sigma factor antagonist [Leptospira yasudae]
MPFLLYTDQTEVQPEDSTGGGLRLNLEGELTIYEASEFKEKLDAAFRDSPVFLELDLSRIVKMDTSCLQILLALKKEAKRKEANVRLVNHSRSVLRLIDLYGLIGFMRDKIKLSKEESKEFSFQYGTSKD